MSEQPAQDVPTLGEIADILRALREKGVTYQSVEFVIPQVWWQEIDAERARSEEFRQALRDALDGR
jgi:hypothetical protein